MLLAAAAGNRAATRRGVSGEMCLCRIVPSLPIRNVSGAPVTPQSIAALPSGSNPELTYGSAEPRQPLDRGRSIVLHVQSVDRHAGPRELDEECVLVAAFDAPRSPDVDERHAARERLGAQQVVRIRDARQGERRHRLAEQRRRDMVRVEAQTDAEQDCDDDEDRERNHIAPHDYAAPGAGCAVACSVLRTATR